MTDVVEAARFNNRVEADLARLYLESEGVEALTAFAWAAAYGHAARRARAPQARKAFEAESDPKRAAMIFKDDESRHTLSAWLKVALLMSAVSVVGSIAPAGTNNGMRSSGAGATTA